MFAERFARPELIAHFYEAAACPGHWDTALAALCDAFEAEAGVLFHQTADEKPQLIAANPRMDAALSGLPGLGITPGDRHRLRANLELGGGARAGLGLDRAIRHHGFDADERPALDRVAGHLAAALRLEQRLATERLQSAARGAALDQWRHGAVIAAADGHVLFANFAAESLAEQGGLILTAERIAASDPAEAETLAGLMRAAARQGRSGCTRITRPRGKLLAASVDPLPLALAAEFASARALVLITIRDLTASSETSPAELHGLFGLTAAESALLPQLLSGDSAALIAQSRGVAEATVRAQVARILTKTHATNLRALAATLSGW